jgi:predicted TIM-barrel fold metal-dependent hydrolase
MTETTESGPRAVVDSLCLAFTPDRAPAWEEAVAAQGLSLKVRQGADDGFAEPPDMVARLDELGIGVAVVVASDAHVHPTPHQVSAVTFRQDEVEALVRGFPGRFGAVWSVEPQLGSAGVDRLEEMLARPWVVGAFLHTHSFDRTFDHADLYPFYDACRRAGVPMVMQAGASGGRMPSACGHPIGIDRPAIYFPEVQFVLSHTGWPWTEEAVAMARKFENVYLSSASWPPRRWARSLMDLARSPSGASKLLFATNFPTVGHRQALRQLDELDLPGENLTAVLGDNARSVFRRVPELGAPGAVER